MGDKSKKKLLFRFGFCYIWIVQDVGDDTLFIKTFKLIDSFSQKLHSDIVSSPKVNYYQQYKSLLTIEQYLSIDLSYKLLIVLSKFRCSTHDLMIEKGRHTSIDRDLRYCPICLISNISVVDEAHLLFFCPSYENIRSLYFPPRWLRNRNKESFCQIMATKSNLCIIRIAYFLYNAFKSREELHSIYTHFCISMLKLKNLSLFFLYIKQSRTLF